MKIQLDTEAKTIKLEYSEKLSEIIAVLEKILPKGQWKEYQLQTNVTISNWSTPIVIREYDRYPWWQTSHTFTTSNCDNINGSSVQDQGPVFCSNVFNLVA